MAEAICATTELDFEGDANQTVQVRSVDVPPFYTNGVE
jgi:hypothetical protein